MIFTFQFLGALLLGTFSAEAQERETQKVRVAFDSVNQEIKEEFYVYADEPEVKTGPYTSYYKSGRLKVKGQYKDGLPVGDYTGFYHNEDDSFLFQGFRRWIYLFKEPLINLYFFAKKQENDRTSGELRR